MDCCCKGLRPIFCAVLTTFAIVSAAAPATDNGIEQLLETRLSSAARYAQRPEEAPSMVTVIGADEIRRHGWRKLSDALASLRGVHLTYDRGYTYIGVRGFGRPGDYNARVLMLIDGTPINDGVYDQAPIGAEFPLDLTLVDRIEYVPGAGSVMHGGNAFFAVINVVTASGANRQSMVEAGAGSGRQSELRMVGSNRDAAGNDWLVSATQTRSRGRDLYFDSYAAPGANAWSRGLDHEASDNLFARYSHGGLQANLIVSDRLKGRPGGPWGADLDDPRNRERDRRFHFGASYEHRIDTDRLLTVQAHTMHYRYDGQWSYAGVLSPDGLENRMLGGTLTLVNTALPSQTLVTGLSWRDDGRRRQFNPGLDTDTRRRALGLFAQDDWIVSDWATFSAGIRHDQIHDYASKNFLSPRLALLLRPGPQTLVKMIGGKAFRQPNAYETDYAFAGTNIANRALRPEHIHTLELGIEQTWNSGLQLATSIYRNRISDMIVLETDAVTALQQHQNVGNVTATGLEVEARLQTAGPWGPLELHGSTSWQQVRHESGAPLANAPQRLAKLLAASPLPGSLRLGAEAHYLGPRTADSGSVLTAGERVGGHLVTHLSLGGRVDRALSWELRIQNLFDRRYVAVAGSEFSANFPAVQIAPMPTMVQDGRMIHGRVRWTF
jgi:outer membrane receptor protein involved in Fe transport